MTISIGRAIYLGAPHDPTGRRRRPRVAGTEDTPATPEATGKGDRSRGPLPVAGGRTT